MKTKEQIIEDIRKWYGLGAEEVKIQVDKVTKCVMYTTGIWTENSQQAIAGENQYTLRVTSTAQYPQPKHAILVVIYY